MTAPVMPTDADVERVVTGLTALAERCEAASGYDLDLDTDIALAALPEFRLADSDAPKHCRLLNRFGASISPRRYTDSLDAAETLVPAGMFWTMDSWGTGWSAGVWKGRSFLITPDRDRQSPTPALALCAAALRARLAATS